MYNDYTELINQEEKEIRARLCKQQFKEHPLIQQIFNLHMEGNSIWNSTLATPTTRNQGYTQTLLADQQVGFSPQCLITPSHSRTSSLPAIASMLPVTPSTRATSFSTPQYPLMQPVTRFGDDWESQIGSLSIIDTSPIQPISRRNTVFSTTSISTAGTSATSIRTASSNPSATEEIIQLSKDQHGCRLLQKKLDDDHKLNFPLIFNAILPFSGQLMVDPFGNYLIQKIIEISSPNDLSLIIMEISSNIYPISINCHGTRAIQKLIDCLSNDEHYQLMFNCVKPNIVNMVHDLNGNHVIQKVLNNFNGSHFNNLVLLIVENLVPISTHKHGCCILQKMISKSSPRQLEFISDNILMNSISLMIDQFGNYVVQYIITLDLPRFNDHLMKLVSMNIINLSCGKFSSNVVEKCLLIKMGDINPVMLSLISFEALNVLIRDQYGNYVVQTTLNVADWDVKCVIVELIKPILPTIKYTNYGKRIHQRAISIANEMDNN